MAPHKTWDQVKQGASTSLSLIDRAVKLFWVYFYHEMLRRNTIEPLRIIAKAEEDQVARLLGLWARQKAEESKYIQLAGGFLFTTVSSSLQWPSVDRSHWSAAALFYCSILFALVSIVCGSQQLLLLAKAEINPTSALPNDVEKRRNDALKVRDRLIESVTDRHGVKLRTRFIFMLQAPIMLLTFSVMTFLAGLCSVVFSPLGRGLSWDSNAKTSIVFGVAGLLTVAIFVATSNLIYVLFEAAYAII